MTCIKRGNRVVAHSAVSAGMAGAAAGCVSFGLLAVGRVCRKAVATLFRRTNQTSSSVQRNSTGLDRD